MSRRPAQLPYSLNCFVVRRLWINTCRLGLWVIELNCSGLMFKKSRLIYIYFCSFQNHHFSAVLSLLASLCDLHVRLCGTWRGLQGLLTNQMEPYPIMKFKSGSKSMVQILYLALAWTLQQKSVVSLQTRVLHWTSPHCLPEPNFDIW